MISQVKHSNQIAMKTNFFLSHEVKSSHTIMASFSSGGIRARMSTGEKIKKINWNQDTQSAIPGNGMTAKDSNELNYKLRLIETWWITACRKMENDGVIITDQAIKQAYSEHTGKKIRGRSDISEQGNKEVGLLDYIDTMLKEKCISGKTSESYNSLRVKLERYEKEYGTIGFDDVNREFFEKFIVVCRIRDRKKANAKNPTPIKETSVGVMVKCLKSIMNHAFENGLTSNVEHKKKYFSVFHEDSDQIALTEGEIKSIYEMNIPDPDISNTRDLFVLSCYTGLRMSDWGNYSKENLIENGRVLKAFTRKTKKTVYIPLNSIARESLSRVVNNGSKIPSQVLANRNLKTIGKMCKMNSEVKKSYTLNGEKTFDIKKRHEMLGTHVARRSFATNCYLQGLHTQTIMAMTGHTSESSFKSYIRADKLKVAKDLLDHPFFK